MKRMSEVQRNEIVELFMTSNISALAIAHAYGVSTSLVYSIVRDYKIAQGLIVLSTSVDNGPPALLQVEAKPIKDSPKIDEALDDLITFLVTMGITNIAQYAAHIIAIKKSS